MSRRVVLAPDGMKADSVYKAEIAVAPNLRSFELDIVAQAWPKAARPGHASLHAQSNGANARSASAFVSDIRRA